MDNIYYISKWKRKRNDYTIMYNVRMNTNMEMKTVNTKRKRRKLHIL